MSTKMIYRKKLVTYSSFRAFKVVRGIAVSFDSCQLAVAADDEPSRLFYYLLSFVIRCRGLTR